MPGIVHDVSDSGQTVFIEPLELVEMSNKHAEVASAEREEVLRILRELSAAVGSRADALVALVEATAAIDLAVARGVVSRGWRGAEVTIADEVQLLEARHPLLDPKTAVPIDLELGSLRALVISGPNTGGKTVALKTLGLAALLHQAGFRPPAESASLPVFDEVLADIGDRQSIEMSLSTFSGHIANLVEILDDATDRSLVLVDEIASGTDPEEGSALAQALVERLAQQARLTVVTTHYPELKEWASARDDAVNAATSLDPETNTPNYRITLGRPGISHALQTAARLGLDESVVAAARERVAPERLRIGELLAETEAAERSASSVLAAARAAAERAQERERALDAEIEKVRASAERERELAAADAQRELADARVELQALRDDMREARRAQARPAGRRPRARRGVDARGERGACAARPRAAAGADAARAGRSRRVGRRRARHDRVDQRRRGRGRRLGRAPRADRARAAASLTRPRGSERACGEGERDDQRRRLGRDRRARPARAGGARGGARVRRRGVARRALERARDPRPRHRLGARRGARRARQASARRPARAGGERRRDARSSLVVRYIGRENVRKRFEPLEGTPGHTVYAGGEVRIDDVVVRPTFGLAHEGEYDVVHVAPLLEEIARDHLVAVLLVRLGGYAVGMLEGERIVTSKVGSRFVKNRHKKGGSSANRFRRRREEQAKALIEEAAEVTASVLSPAPFVALGGDRTAVDGVLAARADLAWLRERALPRFFTVEEPRLRTLQALPYDLYAVGVRDEPRELVQRRTKFGG